MKNCNECDWINITEEQQVDKNIDHVCLKYNQRVIHRSDNPKIGHNFIYPCKQCIDDNSIKLKSMDIEEICKNKSISFKYGFLDGVRANKFHTSPTIPYGTKNINRKEYDEGYLKGYNYNYKIN